MTHQRAPVAIVRLCLLANRSPSRADYGHAGCHSAGIHQKAVLQIIMALNPYLERTGIGELLISPSDVQLENETLFLSKKGDA